MTMTTTTVTKMTMMMIHCLKSSSEEVVLKNDMHENNIRHTSIVVGVPRQTFPKGLPATCSIQCPI